MSLDGTLTSIVTVKNASEPAGEELKRLVLAIRKVIKPFKQQLRSILQVALVVYHLFTMYIFDISIVFYIGEFYSQEFNNCER